MNMHFMFLHCFACSHIFRLPSWFCVVWRHWSLQSVWRLPEWFGEEKGRCHPIPCKFDFFSPVLLQASPLIVSIVGSKNSNNQRLHNILSARSFFVAKALVWHSAQVTTKARKTYLIVDYCLLALQMTEPVHPLHPYRGINKSKRGFNCQNRAIYLHRSV